MPTRVLLNRRGEELARFVLDDAGALSATYTDPFMEESLADGIPGSDGEGPAVPAEGARFYDSLEPYFRRSTNVITRET